MTYSDSSAKRKYRPNLAGLLAGWAVALASAGLLAGCTLAHVPAAPSASGAEFAGIIILPDGTGKGIIIITQG